MSMEFEFEYGVSFLKEGSDVAERRVALYFIYQVCCRIYSVYIYIMYSYVQLPLLFYLKNSFETKKF